MLFLSSISGLSYSDGSRWCWNWQTGQTQTLLSVRTCGFESHPPHQILMAACTAARHRPTLSAVSTTRAWAAPIHICSACISATGCSRWRVGTSGVCGSASTRGTRSLSPERGSDRRFGVAWRGADRPPGMCRAVQRLEALALLVPATRTRGKARATDQARVVAGQPGLEVPRRLPIGPDPIRWMSLPEPSEGSRVPAVLLHEQFR